MIGIVELEIFKETVEKLLHDFITDEESLWILDQFYTQDWFIVLIFAFMLSFFAVVKKIEKLKFMAFLGVSGITVFVIALIINFFIELSQADWVFQHELEPFPRDFMKAIAAFPTIMLALAFQMNFFPIFKGIDNVNILGMRNASDSKMSKASITGIGICTVFYIIVGNIGYALYGYD
jgi:amino acid permease